MRAVLPHLCRTGLDLEFLLPRRWFASGRTGDAGGEPRTRRFRPLRPQFLCRGGARPHDDARDHKDPPGFPLSGRGAAGVFGRHAGHRCLPDRPVGLWTALPIADARQPAGREGQLHPSLRRPLGLRRGPALHPHAVETGNFAARATVLEAPCRQGARAGSMSASSCLYTRQRPGQGSTRRQHWRARSGVPLIATNDVLYHDAGTAGAAGRADLHPRPCDRSWRRGGGSSRMPSATSRTAEEMARLFRDHPDALDRDRTRLWPASPSLSTISGTITRRKRSAMARRRSKRSSA